ncbi:MAG TPA: adenylate/guanylate cyclase domain-containing protein [Alphaproteobacteria bacterium]|nr:adenylate/guanylate cyclase domain-containing protein [Alphaproteobacteria bacterium]
MAAAPSPAPLGASPAERRPSPRYSIAAVLAITLSVFVVIVTAAVVLPLLYLGRETTVSLLREKGDLQLNMIELRVREQMDPAANQLAFIAGVLDSSSVANRDRSRVADILTGALSATPQISSLSFVDPDYVSITAVRNEKGVTIRTASLPYDSVMASAEAETDRAGVWAGILHEPNGDIFIVRRQAVFRHGDFIGMLFARISVRQLSGFLAAQPGLARSGFILYDHDYVLAHPRLTQPFPYLGAGQLLPRIDQVDDPILAAIWNKPVVLPLLGRTDATVHAVRIGTYSWLYILRTIHDYGDPPWVIGTYVRAVDALADFRQLMMAGIGAGVALALAIVAAILLGRRIAQPVERLAAVARHVQGLRFSDMPELPRSIFRELDDQARAFAEMITALRWFEAYVPRKLVRRLALRRDRGPLPSVQRQVTVMFTDIVGFTLLSERMGPVETAELLNSHFDIVTKCIEREEGTIDKFIGDSVMAIWGAFGHKRDHPERAVQAAIAIARAVGDENRRRRAAGLVPIRIRIGIHSGPAVIGNIGSEGRINYTIVGDTVNAAQRIEQLGRQFLKDDVEVVALFSAATEEALGPNIARAPVGTFTLRGRAEPVPVFRLVLPGAAQALAPRAAAASAR